MTPSPHPSSLNKIIAGPRWSPISHSAPSPWQCQGNVLHFFSISLFHVRFLSLFVIAICKHKSARFTLPFLSFFVSFRWMENLHLAPCVRLTGVVGGLLLALGCLFTSFATQFHQLYISYGGDDMWKNDWLVSGLFMGTGISMAQNSLLVMIGQYFKKRREGVEIVLESSAGVGLSVVPPFLNHTVRWASQSHT